MAWIEIPDDIGNSTKKETKEITVYTFFQPPDGSSIVRADMPIDILDLEEIEGKSDDTKR
ncbi:hypothetical protein KAR91_23165 [Candidatus Pacearchaeota archaeon]|nr:hypothetical protein [Candidatus Pacearchaeota archaeon]